MIHSLKNIKTLFIILLIILLSCEQEIQWNFTNEQEFLVVDALITNELKTHEILVNGFNGEMNSKPVPMSGVVLSLTKYADTSSRADTIFFRESQNEPGKYLSEYPFRAAAIDTYQLMLNYYQYYDTALATMSAIDDMEALPIVQRDDLYKIVYVRSSLPSMTDVFYDWSSNSTYCEQNESCQAWETYYTLQAIDLQKEFAPEKDIVLFPRGTTIIRTKYSLSTEHRDFIRSLLIETQWRGGIFDTEQGNVPSNFRHGTKGWFGVCMVLRDTTVY